MQAVHLERNIQVYVDAAKQQLYDIIYDIVYDRMADMRKIGTKKTGRMNNIF